MIQLFVTGEKSPMFVNPAHIVSFQGLRDGGAAIYLATDTTLYVVESAEVVHALIIAEERTQRRGFARGLDALIDTLQSANGAHGRIAGALEGIANR